MNLAHVTQPHPFARFIAILGRGKSLTRSLTLEEAEEAMTMILAGQVEPEQLGAFLMLLRVKEESPAEIAGFARAAQKSLGAAQMGSFVLAAPLADVDWSSYAGKRRQLPWFLLAALALAQSGRRVFMHGVDGHTAGRLYTGAALRALGVEPAQNLAQAQSQLAQRQFAYLPLEALSPVLARMMGMKTLLGLRSPVNTLTRMINPFHAPCLLQSVFHPGFMFTHRDAALLLGQKRMSVFRGEGGEIERRPSKPCEVMNVVEGESFEERWPPLLEEPRQPHDEIMDLARLPALWRGELQDEYAIAAVTGTLAIALRTLGAAKDMVLAQQQAEQIWAARDPRQLLAA